MKSPSPFYQFTERSTCGELKLEKLEARKFRPEIRLAHVSTGLVKAPRELFDFCLVYFFAASGICQINGIGHLFTPRTLLVEPPFQPSHFELDPAMSTRHVAVHFDLCEGFPDGKPIHLRGPYEVDLSPGIEVPVATIFPEKYPLAQSLLSLVEDWQRNDTLGSLRANAKLSQVLLDGCRFAQAASQTEVHSRVRESVILAMQYIEAHFAEPLSPEIISDSVGYSSNYLCRIFRKETGSSVMEFVTATRMRRAMELLRNPRYSVKEISLMAGYSSPRYFSRTFQENHGLTPTRWRRMAGTS